MADSLFKCVICAKHFADVFSDPQQPPQQVVSSWFYQDTEGPQRCELMVTFSGIL